MSDESKKLSPNVVEDLKQFFELSQSNSGQSGEQKAVFSLEEEAHEQAKKLERELIKSEILKRDRGYQGNTRRCPECGKNSQRYKGDGTRKVVFECGEFVLKRAYYVCENCSAKSFPLDEELGLCEGQEQGKLRKKLTLLGVISPYNQAPKICEILLEESSHGERLRRVLLRESSFFEESEPTVELRPSNEETVYLQIDGHLCPTREKRKNASDQGYREAKAVIAFTSGDVAELTPSRNYIIKRSIKAEIAPAPEFMRTVEQVYNNSGSECAKHTVVIADGAKWIWNIVDELCPHAIQILDYAHAKSYLYDAAKILYGESSDLIKPWVQKQQDLFFANGVEKVINTLRQYADLKPSLSEIITYFENNASRMDYGKYREMKLAIGSGAIESTGKQLAGSRIKGPGMRWNVRELNKLLKLRAAFLDGAWDKYWDLQTKIAA